MSGKNRAEKKCTTCDAWVPGGMCRRIRMNSEGTLYVADKENGMAEPLAERHEFLTGVNGFGCIYHGPAVGYAYPSPSGFFFGSPWNLIVDDRVKLTHIDDQYRQRAFALCDSLNRAAKTRGYRRDWKKGHPRIWGFRRGRKRRHSRRRPVKRGVRGLWLGIKALGKCALFFAKKERKY